MNSEPVAITTAITAAILATVALLAFVGVPQDAIAAIDAAAAAWVIAIGAIVRSKVTPTGKGKS